MPNREAIKQMAAALQRASRLLLVAHLSPDGDSLGSLLALRLVLLSLGKSVIVFVADQLPPKYRFLPGSEAIIHSVEQLPKDVGTVVILDCGEWERTGLPVVPFSDCPLLNIDHHRTSQGIGQFNLLDSQAAATGELVHQLAEELQVSIGLDMATCLYTAIVSDTGWFRFSNTTPGVLHLAGELLRRGARQELVNDQLMTMPAPYLKALALVLSRMETFADEHAAISWLGHQDLVDIGVSGSELEGLIDYPRALPGVQVAALVVETQPGICKVSFRSRQAVDVSDLAKEFGGGGHARAAGCTIISRSVVSCLTEIRSAASRRLQHGLI